jgi:hypothetical protein
MPSAKSAIAPNSKTIHENINTFRILVYIVQ